MTRFTCTCICGIEFKSRYSTSKYHTDTCRKKYVREREKRKKEQVKKFSKRKGDLKKVKIEIETKTTYLKKGDKFIPNWKRHGFKSKEEAMIKIIGDITALGFPNTVVTGKGESFTLNPSKNLIFKRKKK